MAKYGEKRPAPALLVSDEDFDVESEVQGSDDEPQLVSFEDQPDLIRSDDDSEWQGPDDGSKPEGKRASNGGAPVSEERTLDRGMTSYGGQREAGEYPDCC